MTNKEIISMVKDNIHGYESISLANDDVERLFIVIGRLQKQNDLLSLGLLQEKNKAQKLESQRDALLGACEMANQIDAVDNGALYEEWKKKLLIKLEAAIILGDVKK